MKNIFILTLVILIASCTDDKAKKITPISAVATNAKIVGIKNNDQFLVGTDINIQVQLTDLDKIKTLQVYFDEVLLFEGKPEKDQEFIHVKTDSSRLGYINIKLKAEFDGQEKPTIDNRTIVLFSNASPEFKVAKAEKKYPHDIANYTQGLEFDGNNLWEGTGQRGQSKVALIDIQTGKTIKKVDLEGGLFGEGITIFGDKIFQLTWQAGQCNVYDKNTLEKINTYTFSGEGWGLTNNGEELIMTDGTSKIVFRNPETFEITKTLYAFDHSKEWVLLNEIEWVEGKIYANVYQATDIIIINPKTGRVETVIDAYDLDREAKSLNPKADVLNGIAYNKITKTLFITGKNYPLLFKVAIIAE